MALWAKKPPKPLRCQGCGEVRDPAIIAQHEPITVKGNWEGFTEVQRARLDPQANYSVNPYHRHDGGVWRIRGFDAERARQLEAELSWLERWSGTMMDRLSERQLVVLLLLGLLFDLYALATVVFPKLF
jgi:hypothetical protein